MLPVGEASASWTVRRAPTEVVPIPTLPRLTMLVPPASLPAVRVAARVSTTFPPEAVAQERLPEPSFFR